MTVATLNLPPGVPSDGTVRVDFIPDGGIANIKAATLAELTAATAIPSAAMPARTSSRIDPARARTSPIP